MTDTIRNSECTPAAPVLLMALELGVRRWTIGFAVGVGGAIRRRTVPRPLGNQVVDEIRAAKARFHLPADAPVESCYEAGPDGFWVHRYLTTLGVHNRVVDSASIEVNRRARRAKTDDLDVTKLVTMLARVRQGERGVWHEVRVPSVAEEDARQPQRELRTLLQARTRSLHRVRDLLATHGIAVRGRANVVTQLPRLRMWNGEPIPPALAARLARECTVMTLVTAQLREVRRDRRRQLAAANPARTVAIVQQLLRLRGVGEESAWIFATELFAWRALRNRREVGGLTGLTPTPYNSGTLVREQGISKAGNRTVRAVAIELAWCWLQYQPKSALSQWYHARWAGGGRDAHQRGIVAVARRLVIALWRYVDQGVVPEGATLKPTIDDCAA